MSDLVPLHDVMKESFHRMLRQQRDANSGIGQQMLNSAATTPSKDTIAAAPAGYVEKFADVNASTQLSIINDPELHFGLYGDAQGRAILARMEQRSGNVVFISPSHLKQCGIGEYGRYLSDQFRDLGETVRVMRTSSAVFDLGAAFLKNTLIIVNHGPGLFDGLNPRLSQGESTMQLLQNLNRLAEEFGALPLFIHHSLIDTDHHLLFSRQQQILNSNIPSVTFISSAGRNFFLPFVELGVSPVPLPPVDEDRDEDRDGRPEVVGFFGFFQYGGKDFDSLFHLTRELRARLVGSVATGNATELEKFEETLEKGGIEHELGSGWVTDVELLQRLDAADYFYLPQNDYDHWNNSATARFVANLDRPLFLPPHHPFLDMADGAIFATTEDLPRIVAHFREPKQYDAAVRRVQQFRHRAAMINTAREIRDNLVPRLATLGNTLLAGPIETSAERYLELDAPMQASFAAALAAESSDLTAVVAKAGGLYRSVQPKQFWRKHYEIGDLVFPTMNETLHAAYLALCKRHPNFAELVTMVDALETAQKAGNSPHDSAPVDYPELVRTAITMALGTKSTLLHDPQVVLLRNGAPETWARALQPHAISEFLTAKAKAQSKIAASLSGKPETHPRITNLVELLVLPPQVIAKRAADIDLSALNFEAIHARPSLVDRFNALLRAADSAGITLGAHMVMDRPQVPPVNHRTTSYAIEDFIFFDGDMFVLNAFRCLQKRDPFPIEVVVYSRMLSALGLMTLLRHLLARCDGRIQISNIDDASSSSLHLHASFAHFISNMRDPMSGLVEARNDYEILRRNNARWWLANKTVTDQYWIESGGNVELINLIYAKLSVSAQPMQSKADIAQYLTIFGHMLSLVNDEQMEVLFPNRPLLLRHIPKLTAANGFIGFHAPEAIGAWVDGTSGCVTVKLAANFAPLPDEIPQLRLQAGFFGSKELGQRELNISVKYQDDKTQEWQDVDTTSAIIADDDLIVQIDCPNMRAEAIVIIQMSLDQVSSPAKLGMSADARTLGLRLVSLELGAHKPNPPSDSTLPPAAETNNSVAPVLSEMES